MNLTDNNKINDKSQNNEKDKNKKHQNELKQFLDYLLFTLSFHKKNCSLTIYYHFRIKIISEEHLIRNHLNIYNLLRLNEKKLNSSRRHSYELSDLIKLI